MKAMKGKAFVQVSSHMCTVPIAPPREYKPKRYIVPSNFLGEEYEHEDTGVIWGHKKEIDNGRYLYIGTDVRHSKVKHSARSMVLYLKLIAQAQKTLEQGHKDYECLWFNSKRDIAKFFGMSGAGDSLKYINGLIRLWLDSTLVIGDKELTEPEIIINNFIIAIRKDKKTGEIAIVLNKVMIDVLAPYALLELNVLEKLKGNSTATNLYMLLANAEWQGGVKQKLEDVRIKLGIQNTKPFLVRQQIKRALENVQEADPKGRYNAVMDKNLVAFIVNYEDKPKLKLKKRRKKTRKQGVIPRT